MGAKEHKGSGEAIKKIISHAWQNEDFKNDLVANPEATIESFLGQKLDDGKTIVVRDQSNTDFVYINIPAKPSFDNVELNEEMLDLVSGGGGFSDFWEAAKRGHGLDYLAWQLGIIDVGE